jgi:hypothetical protein
LPLNIPPLSSLSFFSPLIFSCSFPQPWSTYSPHRAPPGQCFLSMETKFLAFLPSFCFPLHLLWYLSFCDTLNNGPQEMSMWNPDSYFYGKWICGVESTFLFLMGLGFEFKSSNLQSRCSMA